MLLIWCVLGTVGEAEIKVETVYILGQLWDYKYVTFKVTTSETVLMTKKMNQGQTEFLQAQMSPSKNLFVSQVSQCLKCHKRGLISLLHISLFAMFFKHRIQRFVCFNMDIFDMNGRLVPGHPWGGQRLYPSGLFFAYRDGSWTACHGISLQGNLEGDPTEEDWI